MIVYRNYIIALFGPLSYWVVNALLGNASVGWEVVRFLFVLYGLSLLLLTGIDVIFDLIKRRWPYE